MPLNFGEVLRNKVDSDRRERLKASPQLSLGELILKLEAISDKTLKVYFDFGGFYPTSIDSWRGSYNELALDYDDESWEKAPTVEALLATLEAVVGKTLTGYKGGDFLMGKGTPVWIDHYGVSHNTATVDVLTDSYQIIIETKHCEY